MKWGNQWRYCPNCGTAIYDTKVSTSHVMSMLCGKECMDEWNLKYARKILGKDQVFDELAKPEN